MLSDVKSYNLTWPDKKRNRRIINWLGVRSRRCGIVVYLNADVRKHVLLTVSQHNGVFNAFVRKLRLTAW